MILFPAIDMVDGKAVRLLKGDYAQMTVYSDNPVSVAADFAAAGATHIHLVDLEGAKTGGTPNLATVEKICESSRLFTEIGGGIRSMETLETYLSIGVNRVILGTAAVTDEAFLYKAMEKHGDQIAVGIDIRDGFVAIKGWLEKSKYKGVEFCKKMRDMGLRNIICTDISRDGAMQGANLELYRELSELSINVTASGGVSSMEDVINLRKLNLYGAIIGKAYYTGAVNLKDALEAAK